MVSPRSVTAFVCVVAVLSLAGCAARLPDVSRLMEQVVLPGKSPAISGAGVKLSERRSERIIAGIEQRAGTTDLLENNAVLMEALSGHPLTAGNKATLLVDGPATFAAISRAIDEARDHVNVEIYNFEDDEVGRRFADLLPQKQEHGVGIHLIYDSVGCMNTPASFFKRLRDSGVKIVEFNPINPAKWGTRKLVTRRDHRKVVIVDGKVAFTGGVNFSNVYSGSSSRSGGGGNVTEFGWRDTHVMIEGPAVAQFQKLFFKTWQEQNGPSLGDRNYFPALEPKGVELVTVIGGSPVDPNRLTYIMYVAAIKKAERFVHLTNSYFVPDEQTLDALTAASRRGVDVELVLPGKSDFSMTLYAAQSHYEDMLEAGIKLYEHRDRVLHAKTAVIDGVWSTIGSTNFDLWSFARNEEINAIILGVDFANQLEALFEKDKEESIEVTPGEWSVRPLFTRMREWIARLLSPWL